MKRVKQIFLSLILCGATSFAFAAAPVFKHWVGYGNISAISDFDGGDVNELSLGASGAVFGAFLDDFGGGNVDVMQLQNGSWSMVGQSNIAHHAWSFSLATDPQGTPYVAYWVKTWIASGHVAVKAFIKNQWVSVGGGAISTTACGLEPNGGLVISKQGVPYLVYEACQPSSSIVVQAFNGTTWAPVGQPIVLGVHGSSAPAIALNAKGTPYIAWEDYSTNNFVVMKLATSNTWKTVAAASLPMDNADVPEAFALSPQGMFYVAYTTGQYDNPTVATWNENSNQWQTIGTVPAPDAYFTYGSDPSLAISSTGRLYLDFGGIDYGREPGSDIHNFVLTLDGNDWNLVGNYNFSKVGDTVMYSSIALDSANKPYVIFQHDSTTGLVGVKTLK